MCLAIPALLEELVGDFEATVNLGGVRKTISIALVDDVQVGDYVIVHVGHAIGKIDPEEAQRTLAVFAEMAEMVDAGQMPMPGLSDTPPQKNG